MAFLKFDDDKEILKKIFLLGLTGSGKSTSIVSLGVEGIVKGFPGYTIRWLDYDGKAQEIIRTQLLRFVRDRKITEEQARHAYEHNFDVVVCREKTGIITDYAKGPGGSQIGVVGAPVAWKKGVDALKKWQKNLSSRDILIDDSLTHQAEAAVNFSQNLNGKLNEPLTRNDYMGPQSLISKFMTLLADLPCHAIICGHQDVVEIVRKTGEVDDKNREVEELIDAIMAPVSIGRAGRIALPSQVNHLLLCASTGSGRAASRLIYTTPTKGVDVKSPCVDAKDNYPISDGMARYFML